MTRVFGKLLTIRSSNPRAKIWIAFLDLDAFSIDFHLVKRRNILSISHTTPTIWLKIPTYHLINRIYENERRG